MQQLLKCGRSVIRRKGRLIFLLALSLMLSCCSDNPTQPARAPRNTFPDYQHISGYVSGVWTKEHSPYVITGEVYVDDGDSLVVRDGVEIISQWSIQIDGGIWKILGQPNNPVRYVHNSSERGGGVFCYRGHAEIMFGIFEGNGKSVVVNGDAQINHSVFSEVQLEVTDFYSRNSEAFSLMNSIFAGNRPLQTGSTAVFSTFQSLQNYSTIDSSNVMVSNNLFYPGIGDSSWTANPYFLVDVRVKGGAGIQHIQAYQWPGNGNLFGDPKWVKYNFVGPSPAGISDNDYHLQPGSPAIAAASDGTNIGAY